MILRHTADPASDLERADVLVLADGVADPELLRALARRDRKRRPDRVVLAARANTVRECVFDDAQDVHRVRFASRPPRSARVLVEVRPIPHTDAYLGVSDPRTPNHFLLTVVGAGDRRRASAELAHVRGCLELMDIAAATRITVRAGAADAFRRRLSRGGEWPPTSRAGLRRFRQVDPDDYELTNAEDRADDEIYHGPAIVHAANSWIDAVAHLTGHLDPRDGHYHWYGRIERGADLDRVPTTGPVDVQIGSASPARARITHRDPWGNLRVSGIGAPPYPLEPVVVTVPEAAAARG